MGVNLPVASKDGLGDFVSSLQFLLDEQIHGSIDLVVLKLDLPFGILLEVVYQLLVPLTVLVLVLHPFVKCGGGNSHLVLKLLNGIQLGSLRVLVIV